MTSQHNDSHDANYLYESISIAHDTKCESEKNKWLSRKKLIWIKKKKRTGKEYMEDKL